MIDAQASAVAGWVAAYVIIGIICALVFGFVCANYAHKRGGAYGNWFWAGFFFGPLALLFAMFGGLEGKGREKREGAIRLRGGDQREWLHHKKYLRTKTPWRLEKRKHPRDSVDTELPSESERERIAAEDEIESILGPGFRNRVPCMDALPPAPESPQLSKGRPYVLLASSWWSRQTPGRREVMKAALIGSGIGVFIIGVVMITYSIWG
jgi:hypothetical protein